MSRITKTQLEAFNEELAKENKDLKYKLNNIETIISSALQDIINNTCEDSHDHVIEFCNLLNDHGYKVKMPSKVATITIYNTKIPLQFDPDIMEVYSDGTEIEIGSVNIEYD